MRILIGKLVAALGSVLWGWTVYALTDFALSSLFNQVTLPQTHRAALDAVAAVAFIIALWGTDLIQMLETSQGGAEKSFNEMFAARREAAEQVAKELEPALTAAVSTAVDDALRHYRDIGRGRR